MSYINKGAMPPWEEFTHFLPLKTTVYTLNGNSAVQIAAIEPRRVALWIGTPSTGTVTVSPGSSTLSTVTNGWQINGTSTPFVLRQAWEGTLCQWDWYAQAVGNITPTLQVSEVIMRDWPEEYRNVPSEQSRIRPQSLYLRPFTIEQLAQALSPSFFAAVQRASDGQQ